MFSLVEHIIEQNNNRAQQGARQRLIQQAENPPPAELADPLQVPPVNVQQPNQRENNVPQPNVQDGENGINSAAAALTVILYTMAISLIVYGAIHLHDCPAQHMIVISMIVVGALSFLSRILSSPQECRNIFRRNDRVPPSPCLLCLNLVCQLALICFFLAICYWIFSINPDTKPEDHDSPNYCEQQFYRNTYYGCIVGLVIVGLMFIGICCGIYIIACAIIAGNIDDD